MDYEYYYNSAKSRYYDACSDINSKENRIAELKNEKNRLLNEINSLKAEITKHKEALTNLEAAIKMKSDIDSSCSSSQTSLEETSLNFSGMAQSSNVSAKKLDEVYKTDTRLKIDNVFDTLNSRKTTLNNKISDLEKQKRDTETTLAQKEAEIRNLNSDISYLNTVKRNASLDMDYYKRKMEEEEE